MCECNRRVSERESHKKTIAIMMYSKLAPVMWTVHSYRLGTFFSEFLYRVTFESVSCWFLCRVCFCFSSVVFLVIIAFLFSFSPIFFSSLCYARTRFVSETRTFKFKLFLCVGGAVFFLFFEPFLFADCIVCNAFLTLIHKCASKWMF